MISFNLDAQKRVLASKQTNNASKGTKVTDNALVSDMQMDRSASNASQTMVHHKHASKKLAAPPQDPSSTTPKSTQNRSEDGKSTKVAAPKVKIGNKTIETLSASMSEKSITPKHSFTLPLNSLSVPSPKPAPSRFIAPTSIPNSSLTSIKAKLIKTVKFHIISHYSAVEANTAEASISASAQAINSDLHTSSLSTSSSTVPTSEPTQLVQPPEVTPSLNTSAVGALPIASVSTKDRQSPAYQDSSNVARYNTPILPRIVSPDPKASIQSAASQTGDDTDMDLDSPMSPSSKLPNEANPKPATKESSLARRREYNRRSREKKKQIEANFLERIARLEAENAELRRLDSYRTQHPGAEPQFQIKESKSIATYPEPEKPRTSVAVETMDMDEEGIDEDIESLQAQLIELHESKEQDDQVEMQRLAATNADMAKQVMSERERSSALEISLQTLQTQLTQLRSNLADQDGNAAEMSRLVQAEVDLTKAIEDMRGELEKEADRTHTLTLKCEKTQEEFQRLVTGNEDLKRRLGEETKILGALVNASNTNLGVTQRRLDAVTSELSTHKIEQEKLLSELRSELQCANLDLAGAKSELAAEVAQKVKECETTKAELDNAMEELTKAKEDLETTKAIMESDRLQFELHMRDSKKSVDDLNAKLDEAEKQIPPAKSLADKGVTTELIISPSTSKPSRSSRPSTSGHLTHTIYPYPDLPHSTPSNDLVPSKSRIRKPKLNPKSRPPITPEQRLALPEFAGWLRELEKTADSIIRMELKWKARQSKAMDCEVSGNEGKPPSPTSNTSSQLP